ncbi:SRPBCC family protein [uncultured Thiodictyon sp.]|uniref:SRPBCC family protein n=1 Tax=uncultured Thiodictyon sp. TaxID=1846217 RepID=UPI0025D28330|nr:SRPBCC family protein [uncultured Thiodictyon sp.]
MRWLILVLELCAAMVVLADADRETRLENGEVTVTMRTIAGSNLPEVTARGLIEAPPERVWAIIQDCGNFKKTMPHITRSRELSRQGQSVVCEVEIGLPAAFSNLVGVTAAVLVVGPPEWSRTWHLLRGDYEVNEGRWTLTRYGDDRERTLAVYRVHAVPKTALPDALLRYEQRTALPQLFNHLRQITKD